MNEKSIVIIAYNRILSSIKNKYQAAIFVDLDGWPILGIQVIVANEFHSKTSTRPVVQGKVAAAAVALDSDVGERQHVGG